MSEDWIKKIIDDKKQRRESEDLARKTALEQRRRFEAFVEDFRTEIGALLKNAIEDYNSLVSADYKLQYELPPHLVFHACKVHFPSGDVTVTIDEGRERLVCEYMFSDKGNDRDVSQEYVISPGDRRLVLNDHNGRSIPRSEIAKRILEVFLRNI